MSYWRLLARIYQGIRSSYSVWQISECELRDPDNVYNCASCGVSNTPCEHWAKHKANHMAETASHHSFRIGVSVMESQHAVCPNCGHCPVCGRRDAVGTQVYEPPTILPYPQTSPFTVPYQTPGWGQNTVMSPQWNAQVWNRG